MQLSEQQVSQQIASFMRWKNWRCYRNNVGVLVNPQNQPVLFGEQGMPDLRFVFALPSPDERHEGLGLTVWVEVKRPGITPKCPAHCSRQYYPAQKMQNLKARLVSKKTCTYCRQRDWREAAERAGELVVVVGNIPDATHRVDDYAGWLAWYEARYSWLHGPLAPRRGVQSALQYPESALQKS